jgi:predicted RNA-binding protein
METYTKTLAASMYGAVVLYAVATLHLPMILATLAVTAYGLTDNGAASPVEVAYYIKNGFARDVTSTIAKTVETGAGEIDLSVFGTGGHLDIRYRAADGATYRAVLTKDAYFDTDPIADDGEALVDSIVAAYVQRDGIRLFDVLSDLRECAGPLGDFHVRSMFPDAMEDYDGEDDDKAVECEERMAEVRDEDEFVLVMKGSGEPLVRNIRGPLLS